jgi:hypothetical protein
MQSQNSLNLSNGIFFKLKSSFKKLYKNSNFYEKRISKTFDNNFEYKPSPHLLSSIIKYQKKNIKLKILQLRPYGKTIFPQRILKN